MLPLPLLTISNDSEMQQAAIPNGKSYWCISYVLFTFENTGIVLPLLSFESQWPILFQPDRDAVTYCDSNTAEALWPHTERFSQASVRGSSHLFLYLGTGSHCFHFFPFHSDPVKAAGIYYSHYEITFVGVERITFKRGGRSPIPGIIQDQVGWVSWRCPCSL